MQVVFADMECNVLPVLCAKITAQSISVADLILLAILLKTQW